MHCVPLGDVLSKNQPRVTEMGDWCEEHDLSLLRDKPPFCFETEEDAAIFKLRWLEAKQYKPLK